MPGERRRISNVTYGSCSGHKFVISLNIRHLIGYERVYLPLCKVADTPFHIQGDEDMLTKKQFGRDQRVNVRCQVIKGDVCHVLSKLIPMILSHVLPI